MIDSYSTSSFLNTIVALVVSLILNFIKSSSKSKVIIFYSTFKDNKDALFSTILLSE